ncbi:hypothetical protein FDP41_002269 [Naegleria fowleri]|uniref:F-box domain-containing protein n=1 Tax=Naegleria fowleri TaxID=5763 RepID=A0A6A5BZN1_NAEFO|nr:uncharacterized protein FDP41_002269 [Naegleria fowleri]KAF0978449.1 hypothetical protein FDP41_002269 [Naegleria fowleri]
MEKDDRGGLSITPNEESVALKFSSIITSSTAITLLNQSYGEEKEEIKKIRSESIDSNHDVVLVDDMVFSILQFLDSEFIVRVCMLVSKQWNEQARELSLELDFMFKDMTVEKLEILVVCSSMIQLKKLGLFSQNLGSGGVFAIASSNYLRNLESLDLDSNALNPYDVETLSQCNMLKNLTMLNLSHNELYPEGVQCICTSPFLTKLTELYLIDCKVINRGSSYIAQSQNLSNLTILDLKSNNIGVEGAKQLAESEYLGNLRKLY